MNDPYSEIYSMMRSAPGDGQAGAPIHIRLGKVLSASPLKVDVAGTTQEAGRFYIARRLLDSRQTGETLQAGDRVLMLTEDDQTFYLMDKVVHL